jgi:hypothetical protein
MLRYFTPFFYVLLFTIALPNEECEITGVKGFIFGMTTEEALNNNKINFPSVDELIAKYSDINSENDIINLEKQLNSCFRCNHETTFMNKKASGTLGISPNGLYSITYSFSLDTENKNKYIDTYFDIKSLLTKKYGKPETSESLEYPYKDDYPNGDHAGTAISVGKGNYWSSFKCNKDNKDNEPYINLILSGDNYKVTLYLSYVNQKYNISKEEKEKKELDEF